MTYSKELKMAVNELAESLANELGINDKRNAINEMREFLPGIKNMAEKFLFENKDFTNASLDSLPFTIRKMMKETAPNAYEAITKSYASPTFSGLRQ